MSRSVLLACLVLALPAGAEAQDKPPATPAAAGRTRAFLDPLGKLWEVQGRDGLDAWFQSADANGDGTIDRLEITAAAQAWFKQLDVNGDGVIDPDEETAYENDRSGAHGHAGDLDADLATHGDEARPDVSSRGNRRGGRGRRRRGPAPGDPDFGSDRTGALMDVSNPVVSADVNLDRGVSEFEAVSAATKRLSRLDMDGDGKLSLAEARARRDAQQSVQRERSHPTAAQSQQN